MALPRHKKLIRAYKRRTRRLRRYARFALGEQVAYRRYRSAGNPPDQARAVIFGQGRSGSTLLESLIGSTGHFREHGELLAGKIKTVKDPLAFVVGLSRFHRGHFVFNVKLKHLTERQSPPLDPYTFFKELHDRGWKIIHIRRDNVVMQAVSSLLAWERGAFHKFSDEEEHVTFRVDPEDFVQRVHDRLRDLRQEQAVIEKLPHEAVVYERDLAQVESHQATADRMFDYLGAGHGEAKSHHRKVNTYALPELITNYSEFLACVQSNGWGDMIESSS